MSDPDNSLEEQFGLHLQPVQHYEAGLEAVRKATGTDDYLRALCQIGLGMLKMEMGRR